MIESRPARRDDGAVRLRRRALPGATRPAPDAPCYVISVAAEMVGVHAQTLRYYERAGLVEPARSKGNIRLYRPSDIERLRRIQELVTEQGVNLAGVQAIFGMQARILSLEVELERFKSAGVRR